MARPDRLRSRMCSALAEGVLFGRKPKLTPRQAREALQRVKAGEPLREVALSYNVDHSTICRLKARYAERLSFPRG